MKHIDPMPILGALLTATAFAGAAWVVVRLVLFACTQVGCVW